MLPIRMGYKMGCAGSFFTRCREQCRHRGPLPKEAAPAPKVDQLAALNLPKPNLVVARGRGGIEKGPFLRREVSSESQNHFKVVKLIQYVSISFPFNWLILINTGTASLIPSCKGPRNLSSTKARQVLSALPMSTTRYYQAGWSWFPMRGGSFNTKKGHYLSLSQRSTHVNSNAENKKKLTGLVTTSKCNSRWQWRGFLWIPRSSLSRAPARTSKHRCLSRVFPMWRLLKGDTVPHNGSCYEEMKWPWDLGVQLLRPCIYINIQDCIIYIYIYYKLYIFYI